MVEVEETLEIDIIDSKRTSGVQMGCAAAKGGGRLIDDRPARRGDLNATQASITAPSQPACPKSTSEERKRKRPQTGACDNGFSTYQERRLPKTTVTGRRRDSKRRKGVWGGDLLSCFSDGRSLDETTWTTSDGGERGRPAKIPIRKLIDQDHCVP